MTSYEFWEELNKVFNAVVSYQEKSIEFNKKFITPKMLCLSCKRALKLSMH